MAIITDWPMRVLTPRNVSIWPEYMTRPGQQATNGMRRSGGVTAAGYRLRLIDIPVFDEEKFRTLTAMIALMEGDANLIRINLPDLYGIDGPYALATKARRQEYPNGVPFASDVLFSGGAGFAVSKITGEFAAAAALGAREIHVTAEDEVPGGVAISIDDFCYTVTGSWTEAGLNRVRISPPLRKAAAQGDVIDFAPVFVGHCTTPGAGSESRQYGEYGFYSFDFVEDLTRLVESVD